MERRIKKHDAATVEIVRCLLNSIPDDNSPKNIRDKAVIALGFAVAFRRSELCAIDVENLKWVFRGTQEIFSNRGGAFQDRPRGARNDEGDISEQRQVSITYRVVKEMA